MVSILATVENAKMSNVVASLGYIAPGLVRGQIYRQYIIHVYKSQRVIPRK